MIDLPYIIDFLKLYQQYTIDEIIDYMTNVVDIEEDIYFARLLDELEGLYNKIDKKLSEKN